MSIGAVDAQQPGRSNRRAARGLGWRGAGSLSVDQTTAWQSAGTKTVALTTPMAVRPAGTYVIVGVLSVGTTWPTIQVATSAPSINAVLSAAAGFRYGEQAGGAVPELVMGAAGGQPGAHRQHRRGPVQGLNLRLFVHADHDRLVRGVQIQAHHVADLGVEFGVGGELERPDPPGLQLLLAPDPGHGGEGDPQFPSDQPRRPVGDPQTSPAAAPTWRPRSRPRRAPAGDPSGRRSLTRPPHRPGSGSANRSPWAARPPPGGRSPHSADPHRPTPRSAPAAPRRTGPSISYRPRDATPGQRPPTCPTSANPDRKVSYNGDDDPFLLLLRQRDKTIPRTATNTPTTAPTWPESTLLSSTTLAHPQRSEGVLTD